MRALLMPAVALLLMLPACGRDERGYQKRIASGNVRAEVAGAEAPQPGGIVPGIHPAVVYGDRRNPHTGDPAAIMTGRRLFVGFNCAGCHAPYGGGGMGPNLRDSLWIFGNSDVQIYSSIAEGRAAGMPAWGGKLPEDQIWMIVAYLRTLGTPEEPEKPPTPSRTVASQ
jgi:cytochrome c oxidase cbb3-type subunit 3